MFTASQRNETLSLLEKEKLPLSNKRKRLIPYAVLVLVLSVLGALMVVYPMTGKSDLVVSTVQEQLGIIFYLKTII